MFSPKLARELDISRTSVQRILSNDLRLQAYKIRNEPLVIDEHKEKRIKFANWIRTNFRKEDTMKILFLMRRCSTLTEFITLKMTEYGRLIVQKPISKVVPGKNVNFRKWLWFGLEFSPKVYHL